MIFIGTGEHIDDLEQFKIKPFVSKLLGLGDVKGLIDKVNELESDNGQQIQRKLKYGHFTLRDMYEQYANFSKIGIISQLMVSKSYPHLNLNKSYVWLMCQFLQEMLPKVAQTFTKKYGSEQQTTAKLKKAIVIMDSMTNAELHSEDGAKLFSKQPTKITRVARGSGVTERDVRELLTQFKQFVDVGKQCGFVNGYMQ